MTRKPSFLSFLGENKTMGDWECSAAETWRNPKRSEEDSKKLDHNAKERIRRMKLNASFLALRALLPNSSRSKKKWSAPAIVDRVLMYIPELENDIETLRHKKEDIKAKGNKNISATYDYESPTISLNRINEAEAIIQVCMGRIQDDDDDDSHFTNLLQTLEHHQGIKINSASALHISNTRICYQLHIKISNTSSQADYHFEELVDKVNSWLS